MIATRRTVRTAVGLATILTTAAWVAAAGAAGGGTTSGGGATAGGHAGGGAVSAGGGDAHVSAPTGGGGDAHVSAPAASSGEHAGPAVSIPASPPANETGSRIIGSASGPNPNGGNANAQPTQNNDRPAWRHRDHNGGYNYGNPTFYSAFPTYGDGYINAGIDGYYNGYYGYTDQGYDNGPPVVEPGTNGNAQAEQSAPPPAPSSSNNPSPVSAVAQQQNAADNNPQVIAADAAVVQAQKAFDIERNRVLAALANQPAYQQALARRGAAQQQLNAARVGDAVPDPSHVAPAATAKMDAGDEVTRLRQQAIDNDPAAKTAEVRLHEAVLRRNQVRAAAAASYK